jgi:hypothetical protein
MNIAHNDPNKQDIVDQMTREDREAVRENDPRSTQKVRRSRKDKKRKKGKRKNHKKERRVVEVDTPMTYPTPNVDQDDDVQYQDTDQESVDTVPETTMPQETQVSDTSVNDDEESLDNESDTTLADEQTDIESTLTGKIQNYDTRMARMVQEYKLVLNMVKDVTHESVDSGAWDSPSTWKDGNVPTDGARVLIHSNHRIVINKELDTRIRTIKVEGELAFNPHKDTKLYVDTMVTLPGSILRIGEPTTPIDSDKTAQIVISDYNEEGMITRDASSPDYDPLRIGQGILTNGLFLAHGAEKTPYVALEGEGAKQGLKEINLEEAPEGWQAGDIVVVNGISKSGRENEIKTIVSISDTTIVLDSALQYDHIAPDTTLTDVDLKIHVANLSRNIIIKTDPDVLVGKGDKNNPNNVEHRGHVLFMHNNNVNINDIEFLDLGRTNKKFKEDETKFTSTDANARVVKIGTNQAARYPVHFHRAGLDGKIGRVNECVIYNSPGWGYVNHSSNVIMKNNVAYGVYGAAFVTEAGDENGVFKANMAIATHGLGKSDLKGWGKRSKLGDFGFHGNGFWILGRNVDFVDNIVVGSSNSAFALSHALIDDVTGVIDSETKTEKSPKYVALKSFVGNIAYGNNGGVLGIMGGTRSKSVEVISNLLAYSNGSLTKHDEWIGWWYPDNIVMRDITLIGDINNPMHTGIGTSTKLRVTTLENIRIEGFEVGLRVPQYVGPNVIEDAYLNNLVNMLYRFGTTNKGARTTIKGNITYGTLPGNPKQTKMKFELKVRDASWKNYWKRQYHAFNVVYAPEGETPMKLYLTREQSPDYVIKTGREKGKTNAQLIEKGHAPVGSVLVPDDAIEMPGMDNVSGVPQ